MDFNFELIFFYAVLISGSISLLGTVYLKLKRQTAPSKKISYIIDNAKSFFPLLLLVFSVRSFGFESYRIPSGSLKPTLLIGDSILVNKFEYGIRLPVAHTKIFSVSEPQRGDIVVFREPPREARILIKRVIGIPGDHIKYENKILYINGREIPQHFKKYTTDQGEDLKTREVTQIQENLFGVEHDIYQIPAREDDNFTTVVPEGQYFMMGDNRDDSGDSRYWGFLPERNIIGKATRVMFSYDSLTHPIRWERTAEKII